MISKTLLLRSSLLKIRSWQGKLSVANGYSSVDGVLRTYDIRMGKLVRDDLDTPINSFDLGQDKNFAIVSTLGSTIKLLDLSIGDVVSEYKGHHKSDQLHSAVKFSKDNSYIVQASEDHKVVLYDIVSK